MTNRILAILSILFLTPTGLAHVDLARHWVGDNHYRIKVQITDTIAARPNAPAGVSIDFAKLFDEQGLPGRLDRHSLRVVRYNPKNGRAIAVPRSRKRVAIPHQLSGDFANTDAGWIWWRRNEPEATHFHIYFDSTAHGAKPALPTKGLVGVGDALYYNDTTPGFAGNAGLHSTYWHLDWDGDGMRDLIGFGLRFYEYGAELEKELGNAMYFYKNIGTAEKPLFSEPWRIKSDDGNYLREDYLYQNVFPTDWDQDGDIDFFGFNRSRELILLENTGKRDRNHLMLLRPARVLMELPVSDYRANFPKLYETPYFAYRGARYVDWEGDGDRDLIVCMWKVHKIGEQDPSKGIIPYGSYLTIFEVFEATGVDAEGAPVFAKPFVVREERGIPITTNTPAPGGAEYLDWDSDGDFDLLFGDETNRPLDGARLMFCENVGTRSKPLFIRPIPILKMNQSPQVVDWSGDGRFDLIAGGQFFENINPASSIDPSQPNTKALGTYRPWPRSFPRLVARHHAQQVHPLLLNFFTLSVDWDGDGVLDLVGGFQSAIVWYKNRGTHLAPVFDRRKPILAAGQPITMHNWLDPQADEPTHWGPQGPGEAAWGWANPSIADFDSDGDLDMFVTSQRWQVKYFENIGSHRKPRLAAGREVRCNGDPHEFSWRSKVSLGDIDGDGAMEMVVTSHQDNTFYAYELDARKSNSEVLQLQRGQPLMQENGEAVQGFYGGQNNNGDNHSQLVDWDNDGDLDLLNGSLWAVWYYENVGTITDPRFAARGKFQAGGKEIHTFNHAGSFDAADWNDDGQLDLLLGTECPSDQPLGGRLHLFDRAFIDNQLPQAVLGAIEVRPD